MKCLSKWMGSVAALVLLAGTSAAAETVSVGTVKSINADKKEFVLTDAAAKDWTFKLADNVMINRNGKETGSDLKANDPISVAYTKGLATWTARYILVKEGEHKDCDLVAGTVKSFDAEQKKLTFTDDKGTNWTFDNVDAKVRLNNKEIKIAELRIGDPVLSIVQRKGDKTILKSLMAERK